MRVKHLPVLYKIYKKKVGRKRQLGQAARCNSKSFAMVFYTKALGSFVDFSSRYLKNLRVGRQASSTENSNASKTCVSETSVKKKSYILLILLSDLEKKHHKKGLERTVLNVKRNMVFKSLFCKTNSPSA